MSPPAVKVLPFQQNAGQLFNVASGVGQNGGGVVRIALAPGEVIREIALPFAQQSAYMKFRNPASRFALVGVFAYVTMIGKLEPVE